MVRSNDMGDGNNDLEALDNILAMDDQTLDQFSSMLNIISITDSHTINESNTAEDSMDGILSYLESRENDIVRSEYSTPDVGTFTIVSQSIPQRQSESLHHFGTISNGGLPCLDVMLNHLQERETSLERSPEYSIELNMRDTSGLLNNQIFSTVDNRYVTDSSENCSSEIPDNDRRAILMNNDGLSEGQTQNSQSDDLEIIELAAPESSSNVTGISEFMQQPVNLKIDNFVSSECGYDSDKDIDESEEQPEENFNPYIPSFYDNDDSVYPTANTTFCDSRQIPIANNDLPLPGEIGNSLPNSPGRVHLRPSYTNRLIAEAREGNEAANPSSEIQEDSNLVQPFELDSNFDYDNVQLTPRLDHFNQ